MLARIFYACLKLGPKQAEANFSVLIKNVHIDINVVKRAALVVIHNFAVI